MPSRRAVTGSCSGDYFARETREHLGGLRVHVGRSAFVHWPLPFEALPPRTTGLFYRPVSGHWSVCLSVYSSLFSFVYLAYTLFAYLSIYQYIQLSGYLSYSLFTYLTVCLSIYPSFYLSLYLPTHIFIHLQISLYISIYPSICLHCLFIYLSISLSIYLSIY